MNPNLNHSSGIHHQQLYHHHHHHHHHHPNQQISSQSSPSSQSQPSLHHQSTTHRHQSSLNQLHPSSSLQSLSHSHQSQLHHSHLSGPLPPPQLSHQSQPSGLTGTRGSIEISQVQRTNIDNYKSSATPAFRGFIQTTHDALLIFHACWVGLCPKVTRRLHERERRSIDSGAVYVFDEAEAGIKRWTDGRIWSPSRILDNFLVYREIDQKRPPSSTNNNNSSTTLVTTNTTNTTNTNNTTNTTNTINLNNPTSNSNTQSNNDRPSLSSSISTSTPNLSSTPNSPITSTPSQHQHSTNQSNIKNESLNELNLDSKPFMSQDELSSSDSKPLIGQDDQQTTSTTNHTQTLSSSSSSSSSSLHQPSMNRERERALVGSLTSTYKFRPDGLVKKTISVAGMHMISYYKMNDVLAGRLRTPTSHREYFRFRINEKFLHPTSFRVPPQWGLNYDGTLWVKEGTEDNNTNNNSTHPFHLALRPALSTSSNSAQITTRSDSTLLSLASSSNKSITTNDGIPNLVSRPPSAASVGSTTAQSPVSSSSFPLLSAVSLTSSSSTTPGSPTISTISSKHNFSPRIPSSNTSHIGSASNLTNNGNTNPPRSTNSTRYEPYPRPPNRSPLSTPIGTNHPSIGDQQPHSTHLQTSSSLYASLGTSSTDRNNNNNNNNNNDSATSTHDDRSFETIASQVSYGNSGTYHRSSVNNTLSSGDPLYGQYSPTTTTSNEVESSNRSPSVSPSYELPSINCLGGGNTGVRLHGFSSTISNGTGRDAGEFGFSSSITSQQPSARLPSATTNYLPPLPIENGIRGSSSSSSSRSSSGFVAREQQQQYGTTSRTSQTNSTELSGPSSPLFLYSPPSSAPPSTTLPTFPSTFPFSTRISSTHHNSQDECSGGNRTVSDSHGLLTSPRGSLRSNHTNTNHDINRIGSSDGHSISHEKQSSRDVNDFYGK